VGSRLPLFANNTCAPNVCTTAAFSNKDLDRYVSTREGQMRECHTLGITVGDEIEPMDLPQHSETRRLAFPSLCLQQYTSWIFMQNIVSFWTDQTSRSGSKRTERAHHNERRSSSSPDPAGQPSVSRLRPPLLILP